MGAAVAVALIAATGSAGCGGGPTVDEADLPAPASVTTGRAELSTAVGEARPGALLDAAALPPPAVAPEARAWAVAYVLEAVTGQPAAATGLLVVPPGPAPASGWPVVVWAHPTRGTADACAPSGDGPDAIADLAAWLAEGWAVVAPDYEGLGVPGHHPYLVADSGAEGVLRAAQAATEVDGAGVVPGGPVALVGFSQGGHVVAAAAEQADRRAPELDVVGVVLAAPVADPAGFVARGEARADQVGVAVTVIGSYAATYDDVDPGAVLAPAVVDDLGALEDRCIGEVVEHFTGDPDELLVGRAAQDPALAARLAQNQPGQVAPVAPALVVQGTDDDIVDPSVSQGLADRWCARGGDVALVVRPGAGHGVPLVDVAVPWLRDRIGGRPAPDGCTTEVVAPDG